MLARKYENQYLTTTGEFMKHQPKILIVGLFNRGIAVSNNQPQGTIFDVSLPLGNYNG